MALKSEDPAVTNFREYLRIPSVHPDVNYGEHISLEITNSTTAVGDEMHGAGLVAFE